MSSAPHILPGRFGPWVDTALGRSISPESHATCASCALCDGGGDGRRPRGPVLLEPSTKCCTYRPALPNFLVGAILSDDAASGRASVVARVDAAGFEVSPLGLLPAEVDASLGTDHPPCPHLDDGQCGIWEHRHAVCSTWFCKHERGAAGHEAWLALRALLLAVERALALWCCIEDGYDGLALARLVARSGSVPGLRVAEGVTPHVLWGDRRGAEQAFYVRCHERVAELAWEDVVRIGGPAIQALAISAKQAFDGLEAEVPDRLEPGQYLVLATGAEGVLAQTYSAADPILLPTMLLSVLHLFDGRPTAQVAEQLAQDQGSLWTRIPSDAR